MPGIHSQMGTRETRVAVPGLSAKIPCRTASFKEGTEERALIAQEAPRFFVEAHSRLAFWVSGSPRTVCLVCCQRGECKERERYVARALARHKVPVMIAPELLDQPDPHSTVSLELRKFRRLENVTQITGDQDGDSPSGPADLSQSSKPAIPAR